MGPIWVFPRIEPFGSDVYSSLGRVYSRQATASVNCAEFCSVFRHEVLSNFNNIQKSCVHTKFAQFVVVTAFQFVLHIVAMEDLC